MMDDEEMFLLYDYEVDSPAASAHVSTHSCPAARTIRTGDLVKEDWSRRVSIPLTVTRPTTVPAGVNMGRRTSSKHQKRAEMVKELLETGESDGEESPSERKKVMIGPNHQAVVPERADNRDQAVIVRERQCESLLWDPSVLPETTVASFLLHAQSRGGDDTYRVRDDEEALWHLMRAHFDSREALKRMSFAVKKDDLPLCGWNKIEQRNFELGMRLYGKNFHLIQSSKVRTRSVGECVCFYYLWKKEINNALPPSTTRGPGRPPRRRRRAPPQRDRPRWGSVKRTLGPALLPHVTLMALGPKQCGGEEAPSNKDVS